LRTPSKLSVGIHDGAVQQCSVGHNEIQSRSREEKVSVRLRLTRVGGKKDPIWRVVVADQRSPRDGRVIETIGHYNAQTDPSTIVLDEERARSWLARGAQPSNTVRKLLRTQGIDARG
jgi:small subunit ribosomal protein S16